MPLPPITLSKQEPIRLVSPWDDAIDDATPEDALKAYVGRDDLDVSRLTLSGEPTWFAVRGLSPREMRAVNSLIPWADAPPTALVAPDEDAPTPAPEMGAVLTQSAWVHEAHAQYLRFGLISVENQPGWDGVGQERYLGLRCWPVDAIAALHPDTVLWLGSVIAGLSNLSAGKKKSSG